MIIWLPSYPKSGNTFLRSILSSYFFSKDGEFDFSFLRKIPKFPNKNLFKKLGIDINNEEEIAKNYIKVQNYLNNEKKSLTLLKTHFGLFKVSDNYFTDLNHTVGAIYVVRDPRNVSLSLANYYGITNKKATEIITSENFNLQDGKTLLIDYVGSWKLHYNSWKSLGTKVLIIKYEDLILNTEKVVLLVLNFIGNLINSKTEINHKKLLKSINSTKFEKLKDLEKKGEFTEKKYLKGEAFFNKGSKTNYKTQLDKNLQKKIEENFLEEMKELKYL